VRDAGRTLLVAGAILWSFGALVALRVGGVPPTVAWAVAAPICIAIGYAAFVYVARNLAADAKRGMRALMLLPVLRMVAAGAFGWLVIGFLPMESQGSFWVCLVAAYVATLAIETGLLARQVRRAAAKSVDVQGAA
jgi:hypothetical protein